MNAAQIHLALNHAPLFLAVAGAIILITGLIRKNESYKSLSLYFLAGAALLTIPVYLTGEGTEGTVEGLNGVTESAIGAHEDMAKIALGIILVTGIVALAGLFLRKKANLMSLLYMLILVLSLGAFSAMAVTAHLGGKIRHTELTAAANMAGEGNAEKEGKEEKEENEGLKGTIPADSTAQTPAVPEKKKDKDDDD